MEDLLDTGNKVSNDNSPNAVPNSSAVLVLGIISIATCWLYGVPGIICGIIALVLHKKDKELYMTNPEKYEASFKNSKAGNICAIIGLSVSSLFIVFLIVYIIVVVTALSSVF